jgi:hypothetical protein
MGGDRGSQRAQGWLVSVGMILLAAGWLGLPSFARATTLKDVQVGLRTVAFTAGPSRKHVQVAIIHNPQNPDSRADARQIAAWLGSEASFPGVTFEISMVGLDDLIGERAYPVAIVAAHTGASFDRILFYAQHNKTLTISADLACVRAKACVVGVATTPRVEVLVSREASILCGIEFQEAFRMMVTEY